MTVDFFTKTLHSSYCINQYPSSGGYYTYRIYKKYKYILNTNVGAITHNIYPIIEALSLVL